MKSRCLLSSTLVLCSAACVEAQSELVGFRQYPQFRTTSGLPGSVMPISDSAGLGNGGAVSTSIPVAYTLRSKQFVVGGSFTSDSLSLSGLTRNSATDFANGSAWALAGFDGKWGSASVGIMFLSGSFDNVINLIYRPPVKGKTAFAVGVQDLIGDGGASGDAIDAVTNESSRSLFAVATHPLKETVYVTAGIGTNRFNQGFIGASWNATREISLTLEHDGFNFNGGLIWHPRPLKIGTQEVHPAFQLGTIRGKYLFFGLAFGF